MHIAFDIETIPDLKSGEKLYGLEGISPSDAAKAMLAERRRKIPDAVMVPLYLHQIVAISVVVRWGTDNFMIKSLGDLQSSERQLLVDFFRSIEKNPVLISWNGNGYDLPVLQYRALMHSIPSVKFWDTGEFDREAKWNNYQNRYHKCNVDLMDVMARYSGRNFAPLDDISRLLGLPGKIGVGGEGVFDAYLAGELEEIRNYCEIDALNTYLVYLRLQLIRGHYSLDQYHEENQKVYRWLGQSGKAHFQEYADAWGP